MSSRPRVDFDSFLQWWGDGLSLATRLRGRQPRFKQHLLVRTDGDSLTIEHYRSGSDAPLSRHSVATGESSGLQRIDSWLGQHPEFRSLPVIVRLEAGDVLVKRLRYPKAASGNLHTIIGYDIDRQTPFARDDVYFDFVQHEPVDDSDHIAVDLLVGPKREIEPLETLLRDHALRLSVIDTENRTYEDGVNLAPESSTWKEDRAHYRLRFTLFMIWMILIGAIPAKQVFDTGRTIKRLEAQERSALADIRDLNGIREAYQRIVEKRDFVARREAQRIPVVALLNELTKLLPDGTWIQRFDLKNELITLTGESDQASEIPGIVASSQWFTAPRFSSPVTRNNLTGNDRFQIVFSIDAEQSP